MKICTITCHDVYNHGASLQSFALLTYLRNLGHDVVIVDYKPAYLSRHYKLLRFDSPRWTKTVFHRLVYLMAKLPQRLLELPRKFAFDAFTREHLRLTERRYHSNSELKGNPPHADVFICGSDQIWNCNLPNGNDPAFYLDFAPEKATKASYAASFAMDEIPSTLLESLRVRIDKLHHISVREHSAIPLLNSMNINRGTHVLDPVFLLDKAQWETLAIAGPNGKYVLICSFDNDEMILKAAREVASYIGCPVYAVNSRPLKGVNRNYMYAAPQEFLGLIQRADCVITNSFHAICFCLMFHTNFLACGRSERLNSRLTSLLDSVGLQSRYFNELPLERKYLDHIPFDNVDTTLGKLKKSSKKFLDDVLS